MNPDQLWETTLNPNNRTLTKVEINDEVFFLKENESTFVPKGVKHRLSNIHNKKLVLLEIQNGSYLGEDDIIRFEDKYRR